LNSVWIRQDFINCRNPDRGVEGLPAIPENHVINNSNNLDLMRSRAEFKVSRWLARIPLTNSHTVIPSDHWEMKNAAKPGGKNGCKSDFWR